MTVEQDPAVRAVVALIAAQAKTPPPPARVQRPGTVVGYDNRTGIASVRISGDADTTDALSLAGALATQQRVMVDFIKPRGVFVTAGGTTAQGTGGGSGGGSGGLSPEQIEDLVANMVVVGGNVEIDYDDVAGSLTFSVIALNHDIDFDSFFTGHNVATPTDPGDIANKEYVDAATPPPDRAFPFFLGA